MILKIAHRGASAYTPEDTIVAFQRALEMKADALGIDVHVCKSGEVVVIHDNTLERVTNGRGHVRNKTLTELRQLIVDGGAQIATLEETINFVGKRMKLDIELKEEGCAGPTYRIIKEAIETRGWVYNDFFISSFIRSELEVMKSFDSKIQLSVLFNWISQFGAFRFAKKIGAYSINPSLGITNKKLLERAHKEGLKVFVWTVNKEQDIVRMKSLGVDGIFSDFPDRLLYNEYEKRRF